MRDVEFYRAQQQQAQAALDDIDSGARLLRQAPGGQQADVTDVHKTLLQAQLEYWTSRLLGQSDG